jgi:hypothetical protein
MGPEGDFMDRRRPALCVLAIVLCAGILPATAASGGLSSITADDLKEWLTYVASDELEGRETYSAGLGLAAGYIQEHLHAWRVKPAGDHEGYLQVVRVLGVKAMSHSSVTVKVGRETRTFKDGEGVVFQRNAGGRRTVTVDRVEFVGYGLDAPGAGHMDFRGKDVKGAAVVWLGTGGPRDVDAVAYRRLLIGRNRYATDQRQAVASISPEPPASGGGRERPGFGERRTREGPRRSGLHDHPAARFADSPEHHRERRVSVVSLQPGTSLLRRSETQG